MTIGSAVNKTYNKQWSFNNNFAVEFYDNTSGFNSGVLIESGFNQSLLEDITLYITTVETTDRTNDPIEVFDGANWRIHNGRDELYRFSITFRDDTNLTLHNAFTKLYNITKVNYFNDIKFGVKVSKVHDYDGYSDEKQTLTSSIVYNPCMVSSVSKITYDNNNEAQIIEFTVEFKATEINNIKGS